MCFVLGLGFCFKFVFWYSLLGLLCFDWLVVLICCGFVAWWFCLLILVCGWGYLAGDLCLAVNLGWCFLFGFIIYLRLLV